VEKKRMARHEILPEPLVFGKYRLLERIAAGRMGEIFKAKRSGVEGFEKVMVVKRLYPHLSSSEAFVSAFVNEARLTVSLSHANIVQVLDLGQNEGAYYMAMEHVAGFDLGTMRRILRATRKPFPLDIAVFVVSEVAKGLDYAHRRKDYNFESLNIVHRDLCPANVLVSFEGEVKLTDFGISSALSAVGTAQDDVRRRYLYASPEQARGEHLNHRSDIFSLGLILYELVSGIHPYDDPDPRQVQRRAVEGVIEPVRQLVDLPRALEQIINSSLVPELSQRVDSAGTLYEELISYLFASGHKADSRSLSQFMQELKRLEEELFQASQIPPEPELESSDLEDIELEEVESADLEAAPDLWGMAQPESGVAPKRVSGFISRVGHDQMVEAPGMATAAEIPTRRPAMTPRGQSERRFDAVAQPDAMPAGLSALADRLLGGQGAAVILEGALGTARSTCRTGWRRGCARGGSSRCWSWCSGRMSAPCRSGWPVSWCASARTRSRGRACPRRRRSRIRRRSRRWVRGWRRGGSRRRSARWRWRCAARGSGRGRGSRRAAPGWTRWWISSCASCPRIARWWWCWMAPSTWTRARRRCCGRWRSARRTARCC
jgi:serine/threonine protein kinase